MIHEFIKNITESIKNLKEILPKKSITRLYVDMMYVASKFAEAEVNDLYTNLKRHNTPIKPKELADFVGKRYEFHLRNQIELFKHRK
ncbi:MAG: hypothetical protein PHV16_02490 [Candidatus Nanoarchaeia archaeon]|nr:hypothetical protein [Candidatus Nanoarchaeia archaeon]